MPRKKISKPSVSQLSTSDIENSAGPSSLGDHIDTSAPKNTQNSETSDAGRRGVKKRALKESQENIKGIKLPVTQGRFIYHQKKDQDINIVQYYKCMQQGTSFSNASYSLKKCIINQIKSFEISKIVTPFIRRVTFLVWHPVNPKILCVASKNGEIILWDYEKSIETAYKIEGVGPGGSIQAMKFDPKNSLEIYTVSVDGRYLEVNFETKEQKEFLKTENLTHWYCSFDISEVGRTMVVGDNKGVLTLLSLEGERLWDFKLHASGCKITHAEFSKKDPWLLCTSSNDGCTKLWDIRSIRRNEGDKLEPLKEMKGSRIINSAYFSLTDGCRLLTTENYDTLSIYRSPLWNLETRIAHPHRGFQHLTPIRAYWHPHEDIAFVGRYPDPKFPGYTLGELRTLDFFDAETGELLHQHSSAKLNHIMSLNRFNHIGDALASSAGTSILIWKQNYNEMDKNDKKWDRRSAKSHRGDSDDGGDDEDNTFQKKIKVSKKLGKATKKVK